MSSFYLVLLPLFLFVLSGSRSFRPRHSANGSPLSLFDIAPSHSRHRATATKLFSKSLNHNALDSNNNNNIVTDTTNPTIYVTDFGGDPFGMNDSTNAFKQAIIEATTKYGAANTYLSDGIKDCGGVTISLGGGDYVVSEPIIIPPMTGNLRIVDGTIRASTKSFKNTDSYLLNVGDPSFNCSNSQHSCNENIGIENIMLDSKNVVYGGLHVQATMGTVIGPQIFILGFESAGITIKGGHEAMITNAWISQYLYSDNRRATANATGIEIFGNDHYILNTIVFGGKVGLHLKGAANVIQGLHTWNLGTSYGGTGILCEGHSMRFLDVYLDYNDLILVAPIYLISVQNTFFLGGGTLVLRANTKAAEIRNLNFFDSQFSSGGSKPTVQLDESNGNYFGVVENVIMKGFEINNGYILKTTNTVATKTNYKATSWNFDFSELLFGEAIGIHMIDYSIQILSSSANMFVRHNAIMGSNNNSVTVVTDQPCDATVYIKVDQSTFNPVT